MAQLDICEGVAENCYRRESVQVSIQDGEVLACVVYIGESFSEENSCPNASYLDSIVTGAEEHQLPSDYIEWIRNIATDSSETGHSIYRIGNPQ
jgi:cation transport regulator ChaC